MHRLIPQVSVIIPTYNRAELLFKAVESALAQTVEDIEVLVCDDGSTDDSRNRIASLCNPKLRWIPGQHSGRPAPARNRGILSARGEWLAFLDSDDIWFPDKLERQINLVKETGLLACSTNALRLRKDGSVTGLYQDFRIPAISLEKILRSNWVICSSAMINRSLIDKVFGFPEKPDFKNSNDYALWLRVASLTDFAYDNEPRLYYRDDAYNSLRGVLPSKEAYRAELADRKSVINDFISWSAESPSGKTIDRLWGKAFLLRDAFKSILFAGKFLGGS